MRRDACCSRQPGPAKARLAALLVVLGAVGFAGAAAPASAQPPVFHALLRIHSTLQYPLFPGLGYDDGDLFISAEGYTQGVLTSFSTIAERWLSQPSAGQASPRQLARLRSALDVNQVGLQQGACVVMNFPFVFAGTAELSWYSHLFRRSDLTIYVTDSPSPDMPPCSPEVCQILRAIATYAQAVLKPSPFLGIPCPPPPP